MGYGVWELRGNFSTKCFDVAKLGMGLVSCPMLTNRLNKQKCQLLNFRVQSVLFKMQMLKRMYAKLTSHSLAPTPTRVDARDCGLSFEHVADTRAHLKRANIGFSCFLCHHSTNKKINKLQS